MRPSSEQSIAELLNSHKAWRNTRVHAGNPYGFERRKHPKIQNLFRYSASIVDFGTACLWHGDIPEPVQIIRDKSEFQRSPFTHHLTARSLFSECETLYGKKPETEARVSQAVGLIISGLAA